MDHLEKRYKSEGGSPDIPLSSERHQKLKYVLICLATLDICTLVLITLTGLSNHCLKLTSNRLGSIKMASDRRIIVKIQPHCEIFESPSGL